MSLCEGCHAGCCRSFAVPVTGADIIKIEHDLKLSFWDFVCRWEDKEGNIAGKYAPHVYFSDEPETPFVICLVQTKSSFLTKTDKCQFLVEEEPDSTHPLGVAHCGIYNTRPSACRAFPTKLNETGELAVIYDLPKRGRADDNSIYDLCPEEWKPEDIHPIDSVQSLIVAKYEMAFFKQLVQMWNRNPQPWELFPDFLHMVYSQRVQKEVKLDVQPEPCHDDDKSDNSHDHEEIRTILFPVTEENPIRRAA
ncbi:hypothetical protein MNBD_PLANCTO02-410 [hydrothermal vent metagenome]|uniref:YkgJ family cysteine cluster protein n=1 Tax=hydrothermal vent metagenome TaxID=652676 RepID=A0A3B1E6W8_9ZZZZ